MLDYTWIEDLINPDVFGGQDDQDNTGLAFMLLHYVTSKLNVLP